MRLLCCLTFLFAFVSPSVLRNRTIAAFCSKSLPPAAPSYNNAAPTNAIFLAFWDFDGTTMKGDCSEGLQENGKLIFPGLAQVAIEHGLSQIYPPDGALKNSGTITRTWMPTLAIGSHTLSFRKCCACPG